MLHHPDAVPAPLHGRGPRRPCGHRENGDHQGPGPRHRDHGLRLQLLRTDGLQGGEWDSGTAGWWPRWGDPLSGGSAERASPVPGGSTQHQCPGANALEPQSPACSAAGEKTAVQAWCQPVPLTPPCPGQLVAGDLRGFNTAERFPENSSPKRAAPRAPAPRQPRAQPRAAARWLMPFWCFVPSPVATSTRGWLRPEPGAASTSSTASRWRFCP